MIEGTGLSQTTLEELDLITHAEKWLLAYQLIDRHQGVYAAMLNTAERVYRSADEQVTLLVFADHSVLWDGNTGMETYPDVAAVAEGYADLAAFYAAFPGTREGRDD